MPGQAGHDVLQRFVAPLDDEVFNAVYVEGDDGFLAFVGFQEGQGELAVHETVLGEDCTILREGYEITQFRQFYPKTYLNLENFTHICIK